MRITRRTLLIAGGAFGAVASFGLYKLLRADPKDIVIAILHRRVGYLDVEEGSFEKFAEEYVITQQQHERQLGMMSVVAVPMRFFSPYELMEQGTALRRLEDNVVSNYLLSTDFFQNGADESRRVRYIAFHSPEVTPCRHPFLRQS